jgi:acetyltransferase-like isoleucine patch superfamily enzyme
MISKVKARLMKSWQNRNFYAECLKIDSSSKFQRGQCSLKKGCLIVVLENSIVEGQLFFDREDAKILIGKRSFVNGTIISAKQVDIGDDVMISWGVTISDHNSHAMAFSQRQNDVMEWRVGKKDWSNVKISPVKICDKVWIGFNAIILKGVTVGEGAIIGAGSVVTKDVRPWTVLAGNPAKCIREIPEEER